MTAENADPRQGVSVLIVGGSPNGLPSLVEELLKLHRKVNNNYDGFDNFNDYVKYGDSFVAVIPKDPGSSSAR